jgi:hypothetical protein
MMMGTADHQSAPLEGASVGNGVYVFGYELSFGSYRPGSAGGS